MPQVTNKEIWRIAYPIIFGNLAQTLITLINTSFLGHVGMLELGASMIAGIYYYVFTTLAWGFAVGVQIIISRRFGEKRYGEIGVVFDHGLLFVSTLATVLFLLLRFSTVSLLDTIIKSDPIYHLAMDFMKYRHYGILIVCFNFLYRALYVGLSNTKIITFTTLTMAVVNIFLDYALIFGNFGFPKMGISGAAIASVCAEASALIFFTIYTLIKLPVKEYAMYRFKALKSKLMKSILKVSFPTMLQRLFSFGTWFAFFVMIESMGELPIAISSIVRSVNMLLLIPVFAYSATANTLTSRLIGENRYSDIKPTLFKTLKLSMLTALPMILLCIFLPQVIASIYTNDTMLVQASVSTIYVVCAATVLACGSYIFFDAVSGTGNTTSALLIELVVLVFYLLYIYVSSQVIAAKIHVVWLAEVVYALLLGVGAVLYLKFVNWQKKKI